MQNNGSGNLSWLTPVLSSALFLNQGTTTTVLHGNAAGNPSWSAISLSADVTGTLPVANGGTGATTASAARTNLGAAASGANSDITSLTGLTTALSASQGGTGVTTVAAEQTRLGLGTMAYASTGSYALTNGTNATGTWPVSITGNAATATTLSNFTSNPNRTDGNDYSLAGRTTGIYAINGLGTNGPGISFLSLIHAANSTDVAFQIAGGFASDNMYFRGTTALQSGTNYTPWRTVLHSGNYNSYSPTLTGGNASGTWGIDISGNAATATTATNWSGSGALASYLPLAGGTITGNLTVNGTLNTPSDIRLKTKIETLTDVLSKLEQLRGVSYEYKNQEKYATGPQIGVIAQELQKVFPELVKTDAKGYLSVNYSQLTGVLIQAIKEQQQEIDLLRKQMDRVMEKLDMK